jgi:hypothetical protein
MLGAFGPGMGFGMPALPWFAMWLQWFDEKGLLVMRWIGGVTMIAIAMGWAATATIPAATVTIDPTSLKFLPTETQGLAVIDVAGLVGTPLVQDALKGRPLIQNGPADLQEFIAETGIDPAKDISTVTVAKLGMKDGFFVVQGRIDKFKVQQFLADKGKQPDAYLGQTIYYDKDGAIAVLDNLLLVGQVDAVKKALDQMQIPGSSPLRSDLLAAIQKIDAGNQIWGVGDVSISDLPATGLRAPAPVVDMLKTLQRGTYQMRVDTGVHIRATGTFADADSAKNINDLATGALAIAKLQLAKGQADMLQALNGIQVNNSGTILTLKIDEPGDLLKKVSHGLNGLTEKIR